jgi:trimeric autotransporter adhesin
MFSRAESKYPVTYTGQMNGVLSSVNNSVIKVYGADGEKSFNLTSQTYITRYDSEKSSTFDKLVLHANVMIITSGDKLLYIEQLDDKQQLETIAGDFISIIPDEHLLYILIDKKPVPVTYGDNVVVKDSAGVEIPVASLLKDSKVQIIRATYDKSALALSITVQSAPVNKTGAGKATFIDTASATLKVMNSTTNLEETYSVSPKADVVWQDTILDNGLSEVHVGDTVSYDVVNSVIMKITIQQTSTAVTTTVRGQFYSASADGKTISYKKNADTAQEKLDIKFVSDSADITIEGLAGAGIGDLVQGDVLDLTINSSDQVTAIKVVNRKVVILNGVTVRGYDSTTKVLDIISANGKLISVYLTDNTKIDLNGNSITASVAAPLLIKNRKLTLGYTEDKAVIVQFVYKYTGTVTSLNTTSNQITIAQSNGTTVTLPLENAATVDIAGKASSALSDVKVGNTVTALLNTNQDKAVSIQVHTSAQVEVVSVNVTGKKLNLKNSSQVAAEYAAGTWDLFNDTGEKITLSNISAGQVGNLSYIGSTPVSFSIVKVTVGRVLAVAADQISVTDYNGVTTVLPLGTGYSVIKNGVTSSSAGVVQAGDRVEVRKDTKGLVVVTVISGVSKEFWKFDTSTSVLSVKRANLTELNTFAVTSNTKVTQGDTQLTIAGLKDGDKINLYFYQNVLLEIEKIS